ncbi:monoglyceride lipase-like [Saccoglossus kowalevskii]|uniref:Monoglyceride lipase-like n=1 Tax=Saccoglossus kowalevskii TaxID=10224 RepID=A0ABM0MTZ6_SACKO|nr:PREDICTED: monoglyceride lipase-like [Saccoglossus kowalevskii]
MATSPQGIPYKDLKHFVNVDGQCIYTRGWAPSDNIKLRGLCLILHGATEHSGRFSKIAIPLTGLGVMVYAHDHVGHGQSEGDRVDITDFHIYVRDTLQHVDIIKEKYPKLPIFLIGNSMGGAIAILTAMERPKQFTSVVTIGPAIKLNESLISDSYQNKKIIPETLTRDPKEIELFRTDPLVYHDVMKPRFLSQLHSATMEIQSKMASVCWSFFILHGDADVLCDIEGSKMMVEKAQSTDKRLQVYPGHYHALAAEPPQNAVVVLRDITSWIGTRLP